MSCESCADSTFYHQLDQLAIDFERHAFLVRCPDCGSLHEVFPEERRPAREVTVDEARALFPGAL